MGISYGSSIPLVPLSSDAFATFKAKVYSDSNDLLSLFVNIGLSALEFALSAIPGIGQILAVPLGVAFAAARAEATAAITGKDVD